ncbi:hypothetical protein Tsubulata_017059 [Turnera subulata]|uniref:Uncharacterized protein n=1 Tax=Turnera subulata TaxID=218843 RepID=A0A9Q0IZ06_9ROSI|nr:hypothetical protein Tsubulata_017059 [Turnera subulata]
MTGGDGPDSCYRNSTFRRTVVEEVMKVVKTDIQERLEFTINPKTFRIADFGCSVGPNTFLAMHGIIEALVLKYDPPLEFQVFFNDHINNDFNTLFKNIPSRRHQIFSAGVPGDFHTRVFPKASLHIGYSSNALHWLSKNPHELVNPNSPAWNKDSIYCSGHSQEVVKAYSAQFQRDMEQFLNARGREIVGGGLLIFTLLGVPDGGLFSQNYSGLFFDTLGSCLVDMLQEELINQDKVEAFNIPIYCPPIKELESFLEGNADFSLHRNYSTPSQTLDSYVEKQANIEPTVASVTAGVTSTVRAVAEEVIKQQFGEEIVDSLFGRFTQKFSKNYHQLAKKQPMTNITVVLKRKP